MQYDLLHYNKTCLTIIEIKGFFNIMAKYWEVNEYREHSINKEKIQNCKWTSPNYLF